MRNRLILSLALSLFATASCGGGGGGGDSTPITPTPTPPPPDQLIGGIWEGTATNNLQPGVVTEIAAVITEGGDARFITADGVQIVSTSPLSVSGNAVSGQARAYAPIGFVFSNNQPVTTGTLSATVSERDSLSGTWTADTGETGNFNLLYNPIYERDSSLDLLADNWVGVDEFLNIVSSFIVDGNGAVNGQDVLACMYSGQINLLDTRYNTYELSITVTNCDVFNGDYSGLAVLSDASVQNDTLIFQMDNNLVIYTDVLFRQSPPPSPPPPPPPPTNAAPVVDAGVDATIQLPEDSVALNATVTDDGLPSSTLTYTWSVSSGPAGATFADANAEDTTVTFVDAGTYVLELRVSDSALEGSDTVQITVQPAVAVNNPPTADAQSVSTPQDTALPITLTGSDPDGDTITFAIITGPTNGSLSGTPPIVTYTPNASFNGVDNFTFTVNDGSVDSNEATISITVTAAVGNTVPIADAGPDQSILVGVAATLDGTGSFDADGDPLTYLWTVASAPSGSSLSGQTVTGAVVSFVADIDGPYIISLVVNDGTVDSEEDTAVITVNPVSQPFIAHYLFGGASNSVFLGCLNCNSFDADSVCNEFGSYGSAFATDSIWNQFGTYGSEFSTYSPWNSFSSSGPMIIGSDGLFYGYFTTNAFRVDRTLISEYVSVLNFFSSTGDLSATRTFACGN